MKCAWCGEEYERKSNHQKFCSKKCQKLYARSKLKKPKTDVRICPVCHKEFTTYAEYHQVCCSKECYEIYHREVSKNNRRQNYRKKRTEVNTGGCKHVDNCFYGIGGICHYLLITGRTRGCEIEECTKYRRTDAERQMFKMRNPTNGERGGVLSEVQKDGRQEG